MAKRASGDPSDKLAAYRELVAAHPAVELKGATMPYTSVNGHMFSFLARDGTLALRLPSGEREAFITRHKSKLAEQYGAVMKEYVVVPDALLARPADLKRYFDASYVYVSALKPKPTTRKPAAGKRK